MGQRKRTRKRKPGREKKKGREKKRKRRRPRKKKKEARKKAEGSQEEDLCRRKEATKGERKNGLHSQLRPRIRVNRRFHRAPHPEATRGRTADSCVPGVQPGRVIGAPRGTIGRVRCSHLQDAGSKYPDTGSIYTVRCTGSKIQACNIQAHDIQDCKIQAPKFRLQIQARKIRSFCPYTGLKYTGVRCSDR